MSGSSPDSLYISLRPSRVHGVILVAGVALCEGALISNEHFYPWLVVPLSLSILIAGVYWLRKYVALLDDDSVSAISFGKPGWQIRLNNGNWIDAQLLEPVHASSLFIVLRFRCEIARSLPVVLAHDALGDENFRQYSTFFRLADYQPG